MSRRPFSYCVNPVYKRDGVILHNIDTYIKGVMNLIPNIIIKKNLKLLQPLLN